MHQKNSFPPKKFHLFPLNCTQGESAPAMEASLRWGRRAALQSLTNSAVTAVGSNSSFATQPAAHLPPFSCFHPPHCLCCNPPPSFSPSDCSSSLCPGECLEWREENKLMSPLSTFLSEEDLYVGIRGSQGFRRPAFRKCATDKELIEKPLQGKHLGEGES